MNNNNHLSINQLYNCLDSEYQTIEKLKTLFNGFDIVLTPKNEPAHVDCFLMKNNVLRAVIELKSIRKDCAYVFENGYLLPTRKAKDLYNLTYLLKIPSYLVLQCADGLIIWRVSHQVDCRTVYFVQFERLFVDMHTSLTNREMRKTECIKLDKKNIVKHLCM